MRIKNRCKSSFRRLYGINRFYTTILRKIIIYGYEKIRHISHLSMTIYFPIKLHTNNLDEFFLCSHVRIVRSFCRKFLFAFADNFDTQNDRILRYRKLKCNGVLFCY